jgi:arylsulfatase A-like enzyme
MTDGMEQSYQLLDALLRERTDEPNAAGFKGTVMTGGVAGHGSSSRRDVHNTLIAAGPDLTRSTTANTPSANVDFAPTVLSLLGIPIPTSMEGRVLFEAFADGPVPASLAVRTDDYTTRNADGTYSVTARLSTVEVAGRAHWYFDSAKAQRKR